MGKMVWGGSYGGFWENESAEFAEKQTESDCRFYNRYKSTDRNCLSKPEA